MPAPKAPAPGHHSDITRGMAYGFVGVMFFALTMPMTRLAVGDVTAPQLPPTFVTAGRAALAGLLAVVYLLVVRAAAPKRPQWQALGVSALCTVVGFPIGLALALREVPSMHASVVTGVIPLCTAAVAALATRQRASLGFWAFAVLGCALVLAFALISGGGHLVPADGWLALAVLSAACGYVSGAQVTRHMPAEHTICWVLVLALPFTLPAMLLLARHGGGASRAACRLGWFCLCHAVLDVAGLLCLVQRLGPGGCDAREPSAVGATFPCLARCRADIGGAAHAPDPGFCGGRGGGGVYGQAHAGAC
jgi:drug/metabolite transporter (DMT)-like permease